MSQLFYLGRTGVGGGEEDGECGEVGSGEEAAVDLGADVGAVSRVDGGDLINWEGRPRKRVH